MTSPVDFISGLERIDARAFPGEDGGLDVVVAAGVEVGATATFSGGTRVACGRPSAEAIFAMGMPVLWRRREGARGARLIRCTWTGAAATTSKTSVSWNR